MVKVIVDPETRAVISYHNEPGEAPEEEEMPETQRLLEARANRGDEGGPVVASPSCPEGLEEIELPGYTRESLAREAERKAGGPAKMRIGRSGEIEVEAQ